ncbi:hypothetical protein ScPMuIL_001460, partial [Solemya velum]
PRGNPGSTDSCQTWGWQGAYKHLHPYIQHTNIPSFIKVGYVRITVEAYIPNPLRCFKCQRFGHHQGSCKREVMCSRCSEVGHDGSSCTKTMKCANCSAQHSAFFKDCLFWKKEKEIQRVKVVRGMPFPNARTFVGATTVGQSGKSFADAARVAKPASKKTVSVQTDMTWPEQLPTFALLP